MVGDSSKDKQPSVMPRPLPKRVSKATKPFVSNSSTTVPPKSSTLTYDPAIKKLPDAPKPVPTPSVPIKKSDSGVPDKLILAQAYQDELNVLLFKRKVLNDTVRLYQDRIKKLVLECESDDEYDDEDDDDTDGELVKVL